MTDIQRSLLTISIALVVLLAALIIRSSGNNVDKVWVREKEIKFDSSSACEKAQLLASRFPERGMGTKGSMAAAEWLESEMEKLGLSAEQQEFEAWIAGERMKGQNVVGIDKGISDEIVVLIAHYDIPFHVRQGAMDDASCVGVLLEVARIFSKEKQRKTLVFIASDGEEWGMLGARNYVADNSELEQIQAAISLDYVRLEDPNRIYLRGEGQFRGQTPLWLWLLAEDCVYMVGGEPKSPETLDQYLSQAVNISSTDQGPFLSAGVPAINLGGNKTDSPFARQIYHTTLDTAENLRPNLFYTYGRAVELMVRTLDGLDQSTDNSQYYLRTGKQIYVSRYGLRTLQILLFLPLLMATSFQYYNLRKRKRLIVEAFTEFGNLTLFMLPWISVLVVLYLLVRENVIVRYELYPATPLDPFLKEPDWQSLGLLALAFAGTWIVVLPARRHLTFLRKPDFAISKAICLDVLLTMSIVALFFNGFAASLFLAPAALLWGWIESSVRPARVVLNFFLAVTAAIPFVLLIVTFSESLGLGRHIGWYLLLGTGYGLFSPVAAVIAAGTLTVGVRLLQQSFENQDTASQPKSEDE